MSKRNWRTKSKFLAATLVPTTLLMNLSSLPATAFAEEEVTSSSQEAPQATESQPDPTTLSEEPTTAPAEVSSDNPNEGGSGEGTTTENNGSGTTDTSSSETSTPEDTSGNTTENPSDNSSGNTSGDTSNGTTDESKGEEKPEESGQKPSDNTQNTDKSEETPGPDKDGEGEDKPDQKIPGTFRLASSKNYSIAGSGTNYTVTFNPDPSITTREFVPSFEFTGKDGNPVPGVQYFLMNGTEKQLITRNTKFTVDPTTGSRTYTVRAELPAAAGENGKAPEPVTNVFTVQNPQFHESLIPDVHVFAGPLIYNGAQQELFKVKNADALKKRGVTISFETTGKDADTYTRELTASKAGYMPYSKKYTNKINPKTVTVSANIGQNSAGVISNDGIWVIDPAHKGDLVLYDLSASDPACPFSIEVSSQNNLVQNPNQGQTIVFNPASVTDENTKIIDFTITVKDDKQGQTKNFDIKAEPVTGTILLAKDQTIQSDLRAYGNGHTYTFNTESPLPFAEASKYDIKIVSGNETVNWLTVDVADHKPVLKVTDKEGSNTEDAMIHALMASSTHSIPYSITLSPIVGGKIMSSAATKISGTLSLPESKADDCISISGNNTYNKDWYAKSATADTEGVQIQAKADKECTIAEYKSGSLDFTAADQKITFAQEGKALSHSIIVKEKDGELSYTNVTWNADFTEPEAEITSVTPIKDGDTFQTTGKDENGKDVVFTGDRTVLVSLNVSDKSKNVDLSQVSGFGKIEYAFGEINDKTQWKEVTEWTTGPETVNGVTSVSFPVTANADGKLDFSIRATDKAGNAEIRNYNKESGQTIMIDTVCPYGWIGHRFDNNGKNPKLIWDEETKKYFSNENGLVFVFAIEEEYFKAAEAVGQVPEITIGGAAVTPAKSSFEEAKHLYIAEVVVQNPGEYVPTLSFVDAGNNKLQEKTTDLDPSTNPIDINSSSEGKLIAKTVIYKQAAVQPTLKREKNQNGLVLELNGRYFDPARTKLEYDDAKGITGDSRKDNADKLLKYLNDKIQNKINWKSVDSENEEENATKEDGQENYRIELLDAAELASLKAAGYAPDAIYSGLRLSATDRALTTNTTAPVTHTIDTEAPRNLSIKVDGAIDYMATMPSNGATMAMRQSELIKYFNSKQHKYATVTVTAYDDTSGVEQIMLNLDTDAENAAPYLSTSEANPVRQGKTADEFKAVFQIPREEAEELQQLNTTVRVAAKDFHGNQSGWKNSEDTIVNDTITPQLTVSYDSRHYKHYKHAQTMDGSVERQYYNRTDAKVVLTMDETHFFPEDMAISVSRNGVTKPVPNGSITWNHAKGVYVAELLPVTLFGVSAAEADGDYQISIQYHDRSQNSMVAKEKGTPADRTTTNGLYTSPVMVIDTTAPVLVVNRTSKHAKVNTLKDIHGHDRDYYDDDVTLHLTIHEHNMITDKGAIGDGLTTTLLQQDVSGNALSGTFSETPWTAKQNDMSKKTYTFTGDANYTFGLQFTDLAGNVAVPYDETYFTVDKTAPTALNISYSRSVLDTIIQGISFGYYQAPVTATITATDNVSGIYNFNYSYLKAQGVSPVNAEARSLDINEAQITKSSDWKTGTASFTIPKEMLRSNNQFNGTVDFDAMNRAKETSNHSDKKRIVVDNIAPTCSVEFTAPDNSDSEFKYYAGDPTGTITITEANFDAADVKFNITCDGAPFAMTPSWGSSGDVHTGTFTFTQEGKYEGTITYTDKSGNVMATYTFEPFVIDKTKPEINVDVNEIFRDDIPAFSEQDLTPHIEVKDDYLDESSVQGEYTKYVWDEKTVISTSPELDKAESKETEFKYSLSKIGKERGDDGIYRLVGSAKDKAGNTNEANMTFIVNRYGSVYVVGENLANVLGKYNKSIDNELTIYEFNPVTDAKDKDDQEKKRQVTIHKTEVSMTRDGDEVELGDHNYKSDKTARINNDKVDHIDNVDRSKWNGYSYAIQPNAFLAEEQRVADDFEDEDLNDEDSQGVSQMNAMKETSEPVTLDGIYRITVDTVDGSGVNTSYAEYANAVNKESTVADVNAEADENTSGITQLSEKKVTPSKNKEPLKELEFRVDSTAPVITKVQGMEESVYNESEHVINMNVEDAMALDSIEVFVNGVSVEKMSGLSKDSAVTSKQVKVVLSESNTPHKVRIVAYDVAGNMISTDALKDIPADANIKEYFSKDILVSTNWFVRWFNNKPLFWSSIAALIALIAGGIYAFYRKKFKDSSDEE